MERHRQRHKRGKDQKPISRPKFQTNNRLGPLWKIPVPWGDGTIHEVLVEWPSPRSDDQVRGSLHCIAAYLRHPPPGEGTKHLRYHKFTRCIVRQVCAARFGRIAVAQRTSALTVRLHFNRSSSGHTTTEETVTSSNQDGRAYRNADPFPHQTVRFSTEDQRRERKGYTVHIYTDDNGIYDDIREVDYGQLTPYSEHEQRVFSRLPGEQPRLYTYPVVGAGSENTPMNQAPVSLGDLNNASYIAPPTYTGLTTFETNNMALPPPTSNVGFELPISSQSLAGTTASSEEFPSGAWPTVIGHNINIGTTDSLTGTSAAQFGGGSPSGSSQVNSFTTNTQSHSLQNPLPGYYPDPYRQARFRYFDMDGAWTSFTWN